MEAGCYPRFKISPYRKQFHKFRCLILIGTDCAVAELDVWHDCLLLIIEHGVFKFIPSRDCHKADQYMMEISVGANHGKFGGVLSGRLSNGPYRICAFARFIHAGVCALSGINHFDMNLRIGQRAAFAVVTGILQTLWGSWWKLAEDLS